MEQGDLKLASVSDQLLREQQSSATVRQEASDLAKEVHRLRNNSSSCDTLEADGLKLLDLSKHINDDLRMSLSPSENTQT